MTRLERDPFVSASIWRDSSPRLPIVAGWLLVFALNAPAAPASAAQASLTIMVPDVDLVEAQANEEAVPIVRSQELTEAISKSLVRAPGRTLAVLHGQRLADAARSRNQDIGSICSRGVDLEIARSLDVDLVLCTRLIEQRSELRSVWDVTMELHFASAFESHRVLRDSVTDADALGRTVTRLASQLAASIPVTMEPPSAPRPLGEKGPTGVLTVDSSPTEAVVAINGLESGVTPYSGRLLPGPYWVTVSREGYEPAFRRVEVHADRAERWSPQLVPKGVSLHVDSVPQGAAIYADDVYLGTTPVTGIVVPCGYAGFLRLKLIKPDHRAVRFNMKCSPGLKVEDVIQLEPLKRSLMVRVNLPGARIEVDGTRYVDVLGNGLMIIDGLTPGEHILRLHKPGIHGPKKRVKVPSEGIVDLTVDLDPHSPVLDGHYLSSLETEPAGDLVQRPLIIPAPHYPGLEVRQGTEPPPPIQPSNGDWRIYSGVALLTAGLLGAGVGTANLVMADRYRTDAAEADDPRKADGYEADALTADTVAAYGLGIGVSCAVVGALLTGWGIADNWE